MNNGKFETILNTCIERLLKGEAIERCLADYPAEAKELEPLLKTFAAARTAAQVTPLSRIVAMSFCEPRSW